MNDDEPNPKDIEIQVIQNFQRAMGEDPKGAEGKKKTQLQLLPSAFNKATADALAYGASKYGPWNWRATRVQTMTYVGAIRRHLDRFLEGEDIDPESGVPHLGHIAASVAILLDAGAVGRLADDRPGKFLGGFHHAQQGNPLGFHLSPEEREKRFGTP